jgi:hypothetical protein
MSKRGQNAIGRSGKKAGRKVRYTIAAPGADGSLVEVVLFPPRGKGKIDPKLIREAVIKVRDERLKSQAQG